MHDTSLSHRHRAVHTKILLLFSLPMLCLGLSWIWHSEFSRPKTPLWLIILFPGQNQSCQYQLLYKQCNFLVFLKPFTRKSTFLSLKCSTLEKYKNTALVKCLKTLSIIFNIQSFILYIITRVSQSSCQLLLKEGLKFNPL